MAGKFVTSTDVAKRAGVSRSAVSRTFTPGAYVSPEVRQKVIQAADEMGYRVNRLAKELLTARSSLVAIVASKLAEPFIAAQLEALSAALIEQGLNTLLLNAGSSGDISAMMRLVLEYRVRAVIVLSGAPPTELLEQCQKSEQRMILINREAVYDLADHIQTDDANGGALAANHLIDCGYSRLAVVRGKADTPSHRRRANGFMQAAGDRGIAVMDWKGGSNSYEAGCLAARDILAEDRVDGVFCTTDRAALGFLNTARFDMKKSIPGDIGIVGFDDIPEAGWPSHALTTVKQPVGAFVEAVLSVLARENDETTGMLHVVPVELICRGTTAVRQ